jgi:hypothetical protein
MVNFGQKGGGGPVSPLSPPLNRSPKFLRVSEEATVWGSPSDKTGKTKAAFHDKDPSLLKGLSAEL